MSVDLKQDIPDGYKQTEVGVIPEDWIVKPLEYFTSFISYGFTNPMPTVYDGPAMITARDINRGKILYSSARSTSVEAYENLLSSKSKPKINDLLLTKDGTLGRLALVDRENICINQSVALLRPNSQITPSYFKLLLESPFYQDKMLDDAGGSTIKHIYITIVNRMLLGLPPTLIEQTAIANALSDVDALLSELENLIAKKQAMKTATMQQLLTGKTRLPRFAFYSDTNSTEGAVEGKRKGTKPSELGEIPEDWEVYPIHKVIVSNQLGGNYTNSESETEFPLIKMGNLDRGKIKLNKIEYVIGKVSQRDRLKSGDILFNTRNTLELVGKVAMWRNEMPEAYFNSNILRLKFDKTIVSSNAYINAAMNTKAFITDLANVATGTTSVAAIYTRDLFQLNLLLPPKEEQTAIATILSDMDNEIQTLEQRLSKTRQVKQGMMQELLTGRARLPFAQAQEDKL